MNQAYFFVAGLFSCLHFLVYESWNFSSFLELLLGYVKGDESVVNTFDCHGRTPLHLAVKWGNAKAAKLMVLKQFYLMQYTCTLGLVVLSKH